MEQLVKENEELKRALLSRDHFIELQKREISYLSQQVTFFKATQYSPKTEKWKGQPELFNEAEFHASEEADEVEFETEGEKDTSPKRSRPKRKPLPEAFKRVDEILDLPETEKICSHTGLPFRKVGEEVSEKLDIVPAVIQVIRTIRIKYACSCGFDDCNFHIAPLAPQPIPKSNASAGFLAYIATAKYANHCPLNRQEEILQRIGCDLPRSTLASWMMRVGELVTPLINLMRDKLLEAPLIFCDETPVQVHKGTGKRPTSKNYMWVQAKWGGLGERIVLYNYDPTRKAEVAQRLFEGYRGYVQTDGYEGYSALDDIDGITLVGDWVHVRRKFHDVTKASDKSEKALLANYALARISEIYAIEAEAKEKAPAEILRLRHEKTRPIVEGLKKWADEQRDRIPPKSLIGKAIQYFLGQWPKLCYFLDDPIVGPDTNIVENAIRPFAIGRRNWMFSDTARGADASANLFSLVITAKSNGIDPYFYLKRVFSDLPKAVVLEDFEKLLPGQVLASQEPDKVDA
jgi:transposase